MYFERNLNASVLFFPDEQLSFLYICLHRTCGSKVIFHIEYKSYTKYTLLIECQIIVYVILLNDVSHNAFDTFNNKLMCCYNSLIFYVVKYCIENQPYTCH